MTIIINRQSVYCIDTLCKQIYASLSMLMFVFIVLTLMSCQHSIIQESEDQQFNQDIAALTKENSYPDSQQYHIETSYVALQLSDIILRDPASHQGSHILFLNRCENGVTLTNSHEDSRRNQSGILTQHTQLPAYP